MTPIVYIDMLFLLNFLMNTTTIYLTSVFLKKQIHILRLGITSLICALYSSVMFFPQLSVLYSAIFKGLFWIITVELAFPTKKLTEFLKCSSVFFAVNLICGGAVFLLTFATDFGTTVGSVVSNGEVYINISFGTLFAASALAYVTVALISYIQKQNIRKNSFLFPVTVYLDGNSVTVNALLDTGCSLCDPISGAPALIISAVKAKTLIPMGIPPSKYRILPFGTLDKEKSIMDGFIPDKISIDGTDIYKSVVAVAEQPLDFEAIFNPDLVQNTTQKGCDNNDFKATV